MKTLTPGLTILFIGVLILPSLGQEKLREKYDLMIENTETYEQYKVIPRTTIDGFWSEVMDSLSRNTRTVNDLRSQITSQAASIQSLESSVAELQAQLDASLEVNDSIIFLGISFSKVGYHVMVWLIIVALATLAVISYFMFLRSNRVTTRTRKDYGELEAEFEEHKTKAREKQVKLKRELQTAINKLSERR